MARIRTTITWHLSIVGACNSQQVVHTLFGSVRHACRADPYLQLGCHTLVVDDGGAAGGMPLSLFHGVASGGHSCRRRRCFMHCAGQLVPVVLLGGRYGGQQHPGGHASFGRQCAGDLRRCSCIGYRQAFLL